MLNRLCTGDKGTAGVHAIIQMRRCRREKAQSAKEAKCCANTTHRQTCCLYNVRVKEHEWVA